MRLSLIFATIVFIVSAPFAHAYTSPGSPSGYVNDFAGILSEPVRAELNTILTQYAASTTNEISVVTVRSLDGDYIENYAEELFQEWGIGSSKNNNGVLVLLASEDRQLRIEVGYGLEGAIPDSIADRIIRDDMVPALKDGNYDRAVMSGVVRVMEASRNEYTAEQTGPTDSALEIFGGAFIFAILAVQWLLAILARTKSWWLGGIIGLIVGGALSTAFGWWLVSGLTLTAGLTLFGFFIYVSHLLLCEQYTFPPRVRVRGCGEVNARA